MANKRRKRRHRTGRGVYKPKIPKVIKPGSRREVAEGLKLAAASFFHKRGYSCTTEIGMEAWGKHRADVMGNKISGHIVMIECKSSVADFRTDSKWVAYLRARVCDQYYFIFTEEVWAKIESMPELRNRIQKTPGVLLLDPATGYAYIKKRAATIEIPIENRVKMLARLAWRQGEISKRVKRQRDRIFVKEIPLHERAYGQVDTDLSTL